MAQPNIPNVPGNDPGSPKPMPGIVSAAVWIQYATAAFLVLSALAFFAVKSSVEEALQEQLPKSSDFDGMSEAKRQEVMDAIPTFMTMFFVVIAAIYIVFAVSYAILAVFNSKGKNPARILSWILSGIALLCCGLPQMLSFAMPDSMTGTGENAEFDQVITEEMEAQIPAWLNVIDWVSLLMLTLGSILIIIFLAMPKANDYFRKETPPPNYMQ
ncbi:hypothetical protein [Haloglycomyces albus]|uniref:hypothetical protein n=1 Tax=Haloglycomyces albus TaxID=526067 RepID=UPI00046D4C67|nr:hypothetical protein [Haloglycomyces albus]